MTESELQKACLDLLESLRRRGKPILATRTNAGRIRTPEGRWIKLCDPGWGDITACIGGNAVMIECKKPRHGLQKNDQKFVQGLWERAGGTYLLVNNLEVLRGYLKGKGFL